jgi:peptidoglycan/LPS O-acetylase OafA/YrhL
MSSSKIDSLTGIRAIAALWVVVFHAKELDVFRNLSFGGFSRFVDRGYLGVDLFFLLSGFVISLVHRQEFVAVVADTGRRSARFLGLRLARIYPVHLTMLAMFVGLFIVSGFLGLDSQARHSDRAISYSTVLAHLALVHAWGFWESSWNVPSWSVSAEWFAYLTFPLTAGFIAKARGHVVNVALSAVSLGCLWGIAGALHDESISQWTYSHALLRVFLEFTVGCFLYNLYASALRRPGRAGARIHDWAVIACLVAPCILLVLRARDVVVVAALATAIYGIGVARGWVASLFANRVMVHLGEISYSIYMVHAMIGLLFNQVTRRVLPGGVASWSGGLPLLALELLVVVGGAQLMYSYIELPTRTHLRGYLRADHPQPQMP